MTEKIKQSTSQIGREETGEGNLEQEISEIEKSQENPMKVYMVDAMKAPKLIGRAWDLQIADQNKQKDEEDKKRIEETLKALAEQDKKEGEVNVYAMATSDLDSKYLDRVSLEQETKVSNYEVVKEASKNFAHFMKDEWRFVKRSHMSLTQDRIDWIKKGYSSVSETGKFIQRDDEINWYDYLDDNFVSLFKRFSFLTLVYSIPSITLAANQNSCKPLLLMAIPGITNLVSGVYEYCHYIKLKLQKAKQKGLEKVVKE